MQDFGPTIRICTLLSLSYTLWALAKVPAPPRAQVLKTVLVKIVTETLFGNALLPLQVEQAGEFSLFVRFCRPAVAASQFLNFFSSSHSPVLFALILLNFFIFFNFLIFFNFHVFSNLHRHGRLVDLRPPQVGENKEK